MPESSARNAPMAALPASSISSALPAHPSISCMLAHAGLNALMALMVKMGSVSLALRSALPAVILVFVTAARTVWFS